MYMKTKNIIRNYFKFNKSFVFETARWIFVVSIFSTFAFSQIINIEDNKLFFTIICSSVVLFAITFGIFQEIKSNAYLNYITERNKILDEQMDLLEKESISFVKDNYPEIYKDYLNTSDFDKLCVMIYTESKTYKNKIGVGEFE
jgi:hypothetical protein